MADMTARAGFPPDDYISQLEAELARTQIALTLAKGSLNEALALIAAKDAALTLYREAVEVDVKMNGSFFMGVKRDALRRAWEADRAAPTTGDGVMADMTARAGFPPDDYISQLEAELREARAQIAEYENGYVLKRAYEKIDEARAQIAAKDAALLQVLASLVATTSLIIRAEDMKVKPSKAVASDAMFTQMLKDYDNATIAGREALAAPAQETE
jgi:hypothetical protein